MATIHRILASLRDGMIRQLTMVPTVALLLLFCATCSTSHPEGGTVRNGAHGDERSGYVAGADGVRLFYRVDGNGPDTIVVLHGGPGLNLEGLRPDLTPLGRNHAMLYFDQRGSGRSEMPDTLRLTANLMVEDLEAIRRAFRIEELTLFGHSWGGGLAVLYAARYSERVRRYCGTSVIIAIGIHVGGLIDCYPSREIG